MSLGATRIVRLVPDDWRVHRDLRLTALRTDPQAFGATYADNAAYDEATWRARLEAVTYWQARDDADRPIGLVGLWDVVAELSAPDDVDPAELGPFVIAMFVVPAARGAGVGAALLRTLLAEARARGHRQVWLDVTSTNPYAAALYERLGFRDTGQRRALGRDPQVFEQTMVHRF